MQVWYKCVSNAYLKEPLNKLGVEMVARQIQTKKRSLHKVNEHFEIEFNDATAHQMTYSEVSKDSPSLTRY